MPNIDIHVLYHGAYEQCVSTSKVEPGISKKKKKSNNVDAQTKQFKFTFSVNNFKFIFGQNTNILSEFHTTNAIISFDVGKSKKEKKLFLNDPKIN